MKYVSCKGGRKMHTGFWFQLCVISLEYLGSTYHLGYRWEKGYVRYVSTDASQRPRLGGGDDKNEESLNKRKKEPSPEECDKAVEGLSSVKAKAKAKKPQGSQKGVNLIMKKVWAMLLGIGPALRAVASMSREAWVKKLNHWKDEFKSTMQHYWLGTKLLWADGHKAQSYCGQDSLQKGEATHTNST